jgi:hypothetical protein
VTPLDLPVPQLSWKPAGAPQIEQPVELRLPAIVYPDGVEALEADAQQVGAYVYRLGAAGEEFWNEAEQRWAQAPSDPGALPPVPFIYKAGDPLPWQGMLIAIGAKDKDDADRFAKAAGGEPRYRLRAYGRFKREGTEYAGLSEPSGELAFVSGLENQRFGIVMQPADPDPTGKVTILLKNASLAPAGYLEIRASGGQEVEIANCDASGAKLAAVLLAADGSIQLTPAAGRKVVLARDLEAQRIRYLSSDGVTVKNLA